MLNPRGSIIEYLGRSRILEIALKLADSDKLSDVEDEIYIASKLRHYLRALDLKAHLGEDHDKINMIYDGVVKLAGINNFPYVPTLDQQDPPNILTVIQGVNGDNGQDGADGADGSDGADAPTITSAAFVGNDLVFTLSDLSTVTIVNAKVDLKGDDGADGAAGSGSAMPVGTVTQVANSVADSKFGGDGLGVSEWAGWALCDGRNGTDDLRGRFMVGLANADATNYGYTNDEKNRSEYQTKGNNGGVKEVTLQEDEMPIHNHTGEAEDAGQHSHDYNDQIPFTDYIAAGTNNPQLVSTGSGTQNLSDTTEQAPDHSHTLSIDDAGGGMPHENRPPYLVVRYAQKIS